ncbi:MAG: cache domain-containing protein, partial [bacterium]
MEMIKLKKFYSNIFKLIKKVKKIIGMPNLKVRSKLLIFFLFLSILPLTIVGLYSYRSAENTIENKVGAYSQELVKQATVNINSKIDTIENATKSIITDNEIMEIIEKEEYEDIFEKIEDNKKIEDKLLSLTFSNDDIKDLSILKENHNYNVGQMSKIEDGLRDSKTYQQIMDAGGRAVWISGLSNSKGEKDFEKIYIARKLNSRNTRDNLGVLILELKHTVFSELYSDIDLGDNAEVFILDQTRHMISH